MDKTIIVRIIGGLGNQMFQYAFYKMLEEKFSNVKCDIQGYDNYKLHTGFSLPKYFDVKLNFASPSEINQVTNIYKKDILSKVIRKVFGNKSTHINEFDYNENSLYTENSLYLDGYWQSNLYFGMEENLRQDFMFKDLGNNDQVLKDIQSSNSVSLHVRRGDYVGNSVYMQLGEEYYLKAMRKIAAEIENPVFFVFSDDMNWTEKELLENYKSEFSIVFPRSENGSEIDDLRKMTFCKHNIMANSSFSWWGAWLNSNENKIVIYPAKWFTNDSSNKEHIEKMPDSWINI